MKPKALHRRGLQSKIAESEASHPAAGSMPITLNHGALRFKHILVPIDFSDCSFLGLEYAVALSREFKSKITLLHVVEPAVYQENLFGVTPPIGEPEQNLVEAGRERLAALAQARSEPGQQIDVLVRIGRAHSEIADTARAVGAELIVVGTHGLTGVAHLLLGSTAERVVRHAPCPVLTVRLPRGADSSGSAQG